VEDDPVNQAMLRIMLDRSGFLMSLAPNGLEAVAMWESESYDLIIMDVQMPVMNGIEATRVIRQKEVEHGGHIPILAMTAHAFRDDLNECISSGMDSCIAKPVELSELLDVITRLIVTPAKPAVLAE
jgi:CheY-like chemotaxis protein